MQSHLKKAFEQLELPDGFIKVTDKPVSDLTSEQKVILNRKGNILFNQGDILAARRLFITTGYSDGLCRVAEKSLDKGDELDALKLYWLAHNKRGTDPLIEKLAAVISEIIKEE